MMSAAAGSPSFSWDIFCNVIDNYGDIGVTWRLARQLVQEHQQQVRLWVDDLSALAMMCPGTQTGVSEQTLAGVSICHWTADWSHTAPADVVVEAFGCTLPAAVIDAMAQQAAPPLWLNLEYLSAETWVDDCHGLPSRLSGNLQKYFFFPGFTERTGGLLRERDLIDRRDRFQQDRAAQLAYLAARGIKPHPGATIISLFSYENGAIGSWLDELSHTQNPVCLLVPQGRIVPAVADWLAVNELRPGDRYRHGALEVFILPFSTQEEYDQLLWCCDFNVVRGEDSFVRAQWAGRPFLWHIYPQEENAHLIKLESFLARYTEDWPTPAKAAVEHLWRDWNNQQPLAASWKRLVKNWPDVAQGAQKWCNLQLERKNISQAIVNFAQERLSCRPRI